MKINPNMPTMEEILGVLRHAETGSITKISGPPETPEENAAQVESMRAFAQDQTKVRVLCGACSTDCALVETKPCVCGHFICATCELMEEDGVCNHEPPSDPEQQLADVEVAQGQRVGRQRSADEAQRAITEMFSRKFDDIGVPFEVRVNIAMSLVMNALITLARVDLRQTQALASQLAQTLDAVAVADSPDTMAIAIAKFARYVPKAEGRPS